MKNSIIHIRIEEEINNKFKELCNKDCKNSAEVIRRLIAQWVEQNTKEEVI